MKTKSKCVVYRTGGTENFKWHRTLITGEPIKAQQDIERMGYKCFVADYEQSVKIGLPETYD